MAGGHYFEKRFGHPKNVSKQVLLDVALSQVKKYLGLESNLLVESHVTIHENCIPQYKVGHTARMNKLWKWLDTKPHFSLIGSSYKGVAINDIVLNSKLEAERIRKNSL
jgi:oxygen-dependent protoporphyrinogen oxidase